MGSIHFSKYFPEIDEVESFQCLAERPIDRLYRAKVVLAKVASKAIPLLTHTSLPPSHLFDALEIFSTKPKVDIFPRQVAQGSCAVLTVHLPPPAFLWQRAVRAARSLLGHPPFRAEFSGATLSPFYVRPSSSGGETLACALVPTTPNTREGYGDVRATVHGDLRRHTFIVPLEVSRRSFHTESIWTDAPADDDEVDSPIPAPPPARSPADMGDYERIRLDTAVGRGGAAREQLASLGEAGLVGSTAREAAASVLSAMRMGPPVEAEVSTAFGTRRRYNGSEVFKHGGERYFHEGIDLAADIGEPVLAPLPGTVRLVGTERAARGAAGGMRVHGNCLVLDHGGGVTSLYAHMSDVAVAEVGARVERGGRIGWVGSSGLSTGPHLHFGLYVAGQAVDPALFLRGTGSEV